MKRTKNKITSLLTLLFLATLSLTKISCKKNDAAINNNQQTSLSDNFFKNASSQNAQTTRVVNELKQKAINSDLIYQITSKYGYPVWDKSFAETLQKHTTNNLNTLTSNSSDTIIIIPIVQESELEVETYIKAKLTDTVAIEIHNNDEYKNLRFSNADTTINQAEKVALRYMLLTKDNSNNSEFILTDKRLFHRSYNYADTASIQPKIVINSSTITPDNLITVCITYVCSYCNGNDPNCPLGGSWVECTTLDDGNGFGSGWGDNGGGSSGGGLGSGGGGGGTGGGDPCVIGGNTQNPPPINPCGGGGTGGGWNPVIDDPQDWDDYGNPLDAIFTTQKNLVNTWKNAIANENNLRKGNFGEVASDVVLQQKGYKPYHHRITDIDKTGHHGIDGLFSKVINGQTKYYIVESKFGQQSLTGGPPQQMSTTWINGQQPTNNPGGWTRIQYAAGSVALGNTIMNSNPTRLIAYVNADGTVTYKILDVDASGNVSPGNIFTP